MDLRAGSDAELGMDDTRDTTREGVAADLNGGHRQTPGHPSMRLVAIEHDEYDALADLFLGGGGLAPEPFESNAGAEPTHMTHTPVLHLAGKDDHEPSAPGLSALGVIESLEATGMHASSLMAELMGSEQSDQPKDGLEMVRMPAPSVEVVVLGHLPVRATLWARQYACASAKERGEVVALVRAASGTTAIDLITGGEALSVRGSSTLDSALETLHGSADRVILRVDERHEPDLLDRPEVETITVLTGADETAVVASYRLVKTIDAALCERYEQAEDGPRIRIAVMGAAHAQASDAKSKLETAVGSFIARPVEIVIGSGRIDATGTANIFRDTRAHSAGRMIDRLVELAHRAETVDHDLSDPVHARDIPVEEIHAHPVEAGRERTAPEWASASSIAPSPVSRTASPGLRDGLCALIDGLRPIETRCPKAPGVEMGIDDAGRLNLLVCDADCDAALERLYAAQSWSRDHLALLLRAEPNLRFPSSQQSHESDAIMHLISQEPAALRDIYDTPVRMYALARVRVGGVIAQVATALN